MADETTVDETTTTSDSTGASTSETGKDGKPFDADRAQATIEALRNENKGLKGTAKELEAARARLKEIDDASKSETERLASKATEAEQQLAAATARTHDLAIRLSVERTARKLGFIDEDDAARLIDRKAVEMSDDGEPTNVEALLKDLAKAKPHLVKAEGDDKGTTTRTATRSVPPTPKSNGQPAGRSEAIQETAKDMRANPRYAF